MRFRPILSNLSKLTFLVAVYGLTLSGTLSSHAQTSAEGDAEAIELLVRDAYAQNPELQAAFARWQAALERVPQAESLPDPSLSYGYFVQQMNTRQQFRVEQMFPGFGKRQARGTVAQAEAEAAARELETAAADARLQVLDASADYLLPQQAAALVEENLRLLSSLSELANQRYRTGAASQADLLRLENQADTLRIELQSWLERRAPAQARLNAVLGRRAEADLPRLTELPPLPATPPEAGDELRQQLPASPDLREADAAIRRAQQARQLADLESRPDLMVGVELMDNRDAVPDEVMGMVSVTLPVWQGRYRAARREAAAELRAAEASYAARLSQAESDARLALYETRDALRQAELFERTLLPRARQTLAILESGYRTGASSFLDLIEAQRELLELELSAIKARTEAFKHAAQWERLTAGNGPSAAELRDSRSGPQ